MDTILSLKGISKTYATGKANDNITLEISKGAFFFLLGPSGCGKTTLLRTIAGIIQPDEGKVFLAGKDITQLPANRRNINTVFQDYALFPHLNVFENIAFGLKIKQFSKKEIQNRVGEMLNLVQLDGLERQQIQQLSGGQQQRVALARAIINQPDVLLLDEPMAALDVNLRKSMQTELKELHKKLGLTFIYVTHNQEEAMTMGDTVAVMNRGQIIQMNTPETIYSRPNSSFVANFIGEINLLTVSGVEKNGDLLKIKVSNSDYTFAKVGELQSVRKIGIRPEKIRIHRNQPEAEMNVFRGVIFSKLFMGNYVNYFVKTSLGKLIVSRTEASFIEGEAVFLSWAVSSVILLEK